MYVFPPRGAKFVYDLVVLYLATKFSEINTNLVSGIVDLFWFPFAFVFGVIDLGSFPFAIHLIIPVFRFHSIGVRDVFWLVPVLK